MGSESESDRVPCSIIQGSPTVRCSCPNPCANDRARLRSRRSSVSIKVGGRSLLQLRLRDLTLLACLGRRRLSATACRGLPYELRGALPRPDALPLPVLQVAADSLLRWCTRRSNTTYRSKLGVCLVSIGCSMKQRVDVMAFCTRKGYCKDVYCAYRAGDLTPRIDTRPEVFELTSVETPDTPCIDACCPGDATCSQNKTMLAVRKPGREYRKDEVLLAPREYVLRIQGQCVREPCSCDDVLCLWRWCYAGAIQDWVSTKPTTACRTASRLQIYPNEARPRQRSNLEPVLGGNHT